MFVTLVAWVRPVYIGWHRLLAGPDPRHPLHPDPALHPSGEPAVPTRAVSASRCRAPRWLGRLPARRPPDAIAATGFEGPLLLIFARDRGLDRDQSRTRRADVLGRPERPDFLPQLRAHALPDCERRSAPRHHRLSRDDTRCGWRRVAFFAIVEARTGFNVFNHIDRVVPVLQPGEEGKPGAFLKYGAARLRVFGPAQHPIALSAAFVMLTPLALYLARRYRNVAGGSV